MPRFVPNPDSADSPHLGGVQAPWGDLPYLCEMLQWFYRREDDPEAIHDEIVQAGEETENKINQLFTLSKKLGLLSENDYHLLPNGVWIAESFEESKQETFGHPKSSPPLGAKTSLSPQEQSVYKAILFERDWLPMLATVHQVATTSIPDKDRDQRAKDFRDRIGHLSDYQEVNSLESWGHKLKAHLQWLEKLELARIENGEYQLADRGESLHERLKPHYPSDW